MNCRAEVLEVSVEARQVEEAMLAVLHTVLLHRSTGKFHYKKEGTYSIGTVGTQDVDCDFVDFAYVRVSSEELDRALRKAVGEFKVRGAHGDKAGAQVKGVPWGQSRSSGLGLCGEGQSLSPPKQGHVLSL